ncbi:hypothetical protein QTP86_026271 [Hemibagrus guttatus]|nr:hypothetical protein QTP86_026271 [Hemibagrus guttatus]
MTPQNTLKILIFYSVTFIQYCTSMASGGKKQGRRMTSDRNPFTMPKYLAQYRVLEKEWEKQERKRQRTLKVHEKGLKPGQNRNRVLLREIKEEERKDMSKISEEDYSSSETDQGTPKWDYYYLGSSRDFVEKQREISRLKYSKAVGEQAIKDLQEWRIREEAELAKPEERFTEEAFLNNIEEEMNNMTMAVNTAEEEKMTMLTLTQQIQRTELEIKKVKRNIAKLKEKMDLEKKCEETLWSVSPPEWQKQQEARKQIAEKIKASAQTSRRSSLCRGSGSSIVLPPIQTTSSKISVQSYKSRTKTQKQDEGVVGNLEFYEKPQIYFTDPRQLLYNIEDMQVKTERLFEEKDRVEYLVEFGKEYWREPFEEMKKVKDEYTKRFMPLVKNLSEKRECVEKLMEKCERSKRSAVFQRNKEALKQVRKKIERVYVDSLDGKPDTLGSREMVSTMEEFLVEVLKELSSLPVEELRKMKREYIREKIASGKREEKLQAMRIRQQKRQRREAMREQWTLRPMKKKEMVRSFLVKPVKAAEERKAALARELEELERYLLE